MTWGRIIEQCPHGAHLINIYELHFNFGPSFAFILNCAGFGRKPVVLENREVLEAIASLVYVKLGIKRPWHSFFKKRYVAAAAAAAQLLSRLPANVRRLTASWHRQVLAFKSFHRGGNQESKTEVEKHHDCSSCCTIQYNVRVVCELELAEL